VFADAPLLTTPAGLSIAEIKVTGDEFVMLQNNSGTSIPDLSTYWLQDFNSPNPLGSGVGNSSQQLPAVSLDQGNTILLSSTTRDTCGAEVAGKLSVSLTDSGGFLELVQMSTNTNGGIDQSAGDAVSWSSGASGIIQNVPSTSKDPFGAYGLYYRVAGIAPAEFSWQQAGYDPASVCQLEVGAPTAPTPASTDSLLQSDDSPPAIIVSLATDANASATPTLPAADLGLKAPQLTELLPNPSGTGTDDTDEYIELYNPNGTSFDLSGFVLQTGTTTKHKFIFDTGTTLPAKGFTAFYSADTSLSLSNSGGQVQLLDPLGNVIAQTDTYGTAKDGQAWALANGTWYWTLTPTPHAANRVDQTGITTATTKTVSSKSTSSGTVQGAATGSNGDGTPAATGNVADVAQVTPIHPWTLALVAILALLYGLYEYRQDVANRLYRLRKHREARRITRG
jgi:hypothetical protein